MKQCNESILKDSGKCIPYKNYTTSSDVRWATSSSDPMSIVEIDRVAVEYTEPIVITDLNEAQ